jgi:nicotinate-nucleotide adenylyltransferase
MIGIYGGTFNPVHFGHLRSALEMREILKLEKMYLLPSRLPPHREEPEASASMRLTMLELAISNTPELQIDRRELEREGVSYMVDTLKSLRLEFNDKPLLLFIGADVFGKLEQWYNWKQIFDYTHLVVMTRPGFCNQELPSFLQLRYTDKISDLHRQPAGYLFFQSVTLLQISATQIREMVANDENPQFLLPDQVIAFIRKNKLYNTRPITTGR